MGTEGNACERPKPWVVRGRQHIIPENGGGIGKSSNNRRLTCGVIVDKEAGVPRAGEVARPTVDALGGLVEEHVAALEDHLVGVALEVFDDDGPRLRVFRVVHVQYARYDVRP